MDSEKFRPSVLVAAVCWVSLALLPWFLLTNREWQLTDSAVLFAVAVWVVIGLFSGALANAQKKEGQYVNRTR